METLTMAEWRIRNMPERLRMALRLLALKEGKSTNNLILEMLEDAVAKRKGRA